MKFELRARNSFVNIRLAFILLLYNFRMFPFCFSLLSYALFVQGSRNNLMLQQLFIYYGIFVWFAVALSLLLLSVISICGAFNAIFHQHQHRHFLHRVESSRVIRCCVVNQQCTGSFFHFLPLILPLYFLKRRQRITEFSLCITTTEALSFVRISSYYFLCVIFFKSP